MIPPSEGYNLEQNAYINFILWLYSKINIIHVVKVISLQNIQNIFCFYIYRILSINMEEKKSVFTEGKKSCKILFRYILLSKIQNLIQQKRTNHLIRVMTKVNMDQSGFVIVKGILFSSPTHQLYWLLMKKMIQSLRF